ncbi:hypothetical protein D7Y41_22260 [Anaerotruncus sp. 1XD22-93]|nr:hypothetical protein D7Y41_22260 [Anaerotruncus sp. 1XD22-93]
MRKAASAWLKSSFFSKVQAIKAAKENPADGICGGNGFLMIIAQPDKDFNRWERCSYPPS